MIAQMSGQAADAGLSAFLSLLAIISISLGILNLLPIPVLDGGLILFLVIEAIRKKTVQQEGDGDFPEHRGRTADHPDRRVSYNDNHANLQQVTNSPLTSILSP